MQEVFFRMLYQKALMRKWRWKIGQEKKAIRGYIDEHLTTVAPGPQSYMEGPGEGGIGGRESLEDDI